MLPAASSTFYLCAAGSSLCAPGRRRPGNLAPSPVRAPNGMAAYDGPAWDEYIAQGAADGYQMADPEAGESITTTWSSRRSSTRSRSRSARATPSSRRTSTASAASSTAGRTGGSPKSRRSTTSAPWFAGWRWCCGSASRTRCWRIGSAASSSTCSGRWPSRCATTERLIAAAASRILTPTRTGSCSTTRRSRRARRRGDLDSRSSGAESGDDSDGMAAMMDGGGAPGGAHHGHYGEDVVSDRLGDDRSPRYLQNVEAFHNNGGFDACVERLGRPPMSLSAMRAHAPPRACAPVLRRSVLGRWAQRAAALALAAVAGLPNESLKGEDRRTISEVSGLGVAPPRGAPPGRRLSPPLPAHPRPQVPAHAVPREAPHRTQCAAAAAAARAPRPRPALLLTPARARRRRRRHQGDDQPDDSPPRVRRGVVLARACARAQRRPWRLGVAPPSRRRDGRQLVVARDRSSSGCSARAVELIFGEGLHAQVGEPLRRTPRLSRDAGRARGRIELISGAPRSSALRV